MAGKKTKPKRELGKTGTVITAGIISGVEYNKKLHGTAGLTVYDEMRKGDATVRAALQAVKLPILSARWYVEPATQDKQGKDVAEFVEQNLFNEMSISWLEFLRQALIYLDFGRMVFEIIYKTLDDGRIGWHKFAPRLPSTIYRWQTRDGQDGVTQTLPGGLASIPIEKLLIFTHEKEGDNWEGVSILRSSYKNWFIKDAVYQVDAVALERQGLGFLVGRSPINASAEDKAKFKELLRNARANEAAYADLPAGFSYEFIDTKAKSLRDPWRTIMHHDRQITKNVLAQFLELGAGATGSYALNKSQSDFFMLGEEAAAKYMVGIVNQYAIPRLVDFNYAVKEYPKLKFEDMVKIDFKAFSAGLRDLALAGFLTPDPDLEAHLRKIGDLPELPKELQGHERLSRKGLKMIKEMKEKVDKTLEGVENEGKSPDS